MIEGYELKVAAKEFQLAAKSGLGNGVAVPGGVVVRQNGVIAKGKHRAGAPAFEDAPTGGTGQRGEQGLFEWAGQGHQALSLKDKWRVPMVCGMDRVNLGVRAIRDLMFDYWQYLILKRIAPPPADEFGPRAAESKLWQLLGQGFFSAIQGKVVVDFGCGGGADSIEMIRIGARRVIGVDIREEVLRVGRENAERAGISDKCVFTTLCEEAADMVVSVDAFEHFDDPGLILRLMAELIGPDGEVCVSFGPTWYHPLGGHLFSVFPWAHLLFSETALLRWRSDFKNDGAKKFGEVAGGLNQMTIARFEALVAASPLEAVELKAVPIRRLEPVHSRWTREFTTAVVRCRLRHKTTKQR